MTDPAAMYEIVVAGAGAATPIVYASTATSADAHQAAVDASREYPAAAVRIRLSVAGRARAALRLARDRFGARAEVQIYQPPDTGPDGTTYRAIMRTGRGSKRRPNRVGVFLVDDAGRATWLIS